MPKIIENLGDGIIRGAINIIDREGVERLSIRKLSAELGIAASTIYNYYDSKEALIGAAAMTLWRDTLTNIESLFDSEMSELEILSATVEKLRTFFRPLFLFHVTVLKAGKDGNSHSDHGENYGKEIAGQLKRKIEVLLIGRGHDRAEAEKAAAVLANLIFVCLHNEDLSIENIALAIKTISY